MAESLDLIYARRERDRRAEQLRRIRENVNDWAERQETWDLVAEILSVVNEWPDDNLHGLLNVFWWFEIERLLSHAVMYRYEGRSYLQAEQFIDFVIETGYRDQPHDDVNREADDRAPSLQPRRTTPIHHAAQHEYADDLVGKLFTIYDAFNVNYTDDQGFSHFHAACKLGCVDVVKRFLDRGQDPNCPAVVGTVDPPLHLALAHRRGGVAELLLKNGAGPQLANEAGLTPLHQICIKDDAFGLGELFFRTLDELPGHEVQIDAQDRHGNTPLHMAATNGYRNLVRLLLRQGADPNTANGRGTTALHMICLRKDDDDRLLGIFFEECDRVDREVLIDALDLYGYTPLHLAVPRGHKQLVRMLLSRGADPNLANGDGSTPLHVVCSARPRCDNRLLNIIFEECDLLGQEVSIDIPDEEGNTPLHLAVLGDYGYPVRLLLSRGADPNLTNAVGCTALHLVCHASRRSDCFDRVPAIFFAVCEQMDRPVAIDARDPFGNTPLLLVAGHPTEQMLRLLLERGADPNAVDRHGHTPLHTMCQEGVDHDLTRLFFEICDELRLQPLVDTLDYRTGETPLLWAVRLEDDDDRRVELLLRRGADPNLADKTRSTPLHAISRTKYNGNLIGLFFRVSREINQVIRVDARDELYWTPLQWAVSIASPDVVEVLLNNGADLANFVFPTQQQFDKCFYESSNIKCKLMLASGLIRAAVILSRAGWMMDLEAIASIANFFIKHRLFESGANQDGSWRANEDFAREASQIQVRPDLSLSQLIDFPIGRVPQNRIQEEDYWDFARSEVWWNMNCEESVVRACTLHLCEKLSRRFVRYWSWIVWGCVGSNYRLPPEAYDHLCTYMKNEVLWHLILSLDQNLLL